MFELNFKPSFLFNSPFTIVKYLILSCNYHQFHTGDRYTCMYIFCDIGKHDHMTLIYCQVPTTVFTMNTIENS